MIYGIFRAQHLIGANIKYGLTDCSNHEKSSICASTPLLMFTRKYRHTTFYNQLGSMNPINIKNALCNQIGCDKKLNGFKELQGRLVRHKFKISYGNQRVDSPEGCKERCENENKCFLATYSYVNKFCYLYDKNASKNLLRRDKNDDYVSYRKPTYIL